MGPFFSSIYCGITQIL